MEIKINIQKRYFWILTILLIGIAFVIGQSTLTPQQFGHNANQITVTYNGAQVTLQQALNQMSGTSGGSIVTGTYTGDGTAEKFIAIPGINYIPSMVFVVPEGNTSTNGGTTGNPPFFRVLNGNLHADLTDNDKNFKWLNAQASAAGNNLLGAQVGGQYGFYVKNTVLGAPGQGYSTNINNKDYNYFVVVPAVQMIVQP